MLIVFVAKRYGLVWDPPPQKEFCPLQLPTSLTEPHSASDHFAIGFCSSWDSIPACPDVLTQNYPLFASGFGKLAKILKKKGGGKVRSYTHQTLVNLPFRSQIFIGMQNFKSLITPQRGHEVSIQHSRAWTDDQHVCLL